MARPQKDGLDYFPLDVDIDQDDKLQLIEAEFGLIGFGIVIKLFMKIYKEGYFYEWTEKEQLLFSKRVNVDINQVNDVINACIKWGLFDKNIFEKYGVLTSKGIQKRYLEATSRRKQVSIIKEYCLIDHSKYSNIVFVDINGVNANINPYSDSVNDDINPQSKVKKSKVNNITTPPISPPNKNLEEEVETEPEKLSSGSCDVLQSFEKEFGRPLSPFEVETLKAWVDEFPNELILHALRIAILGQNRSFRYIGGILTRWKGAGVKCVQDAEQLDREYKRRSRASPKKNSVAEQNKQVLEAVFGGET